MLLVSEENISHLDWNSVTGTAPKKSGCSRSTSVGRPPVPTFSIRQPIYFRQYLGRGSYLVGCAQPLPPVLVNVTNGRSIHDVAFFDLLCQPLSGQRFAHEFLGVHFTSVRLQILAPCRRQLYGFKRYGPGVAIHKVEVSASEGMRLRYWQWCDSNAGESASSFERKRFSNSSRHASEQFLRVVVEAQVGNAVVVEFVHLCPLRRTDSCSPNA